jgi:hypothetical protein
MSKAQVCYLVSWGVNETQMVVVVSAEIPFLEVVLRPRVFAASYTLAYRREESSLALPPGTPKELENISLVRSPTPEYINMAGARRVAPLLPNDPITVKILEAERAHYKRDVQRTQQIRSALEAHAKAKAKADEAKQTDQNAMLAKARDILAGKADHPEQPRPIEDPVPGAAGAGS